MHDTYNMSFVLLRRFTIPSKTVAADMGPTPLHDVMSSPSRCLYCGTLSLEIPVCLAPDAHHEPAISSARRERCRVSGVDSPRFATDRKSGATKRATLLLSALLDALASRVQGAFPAGLGSHLLSRLFVCGQCDVSRRFEGISQESWQS